jgi:ethanolamine ammonia-lyase small subunit
MNTRSLRDFTLARVDLGRAGESLPTREQLKLQLAHARAREAVHSKLDTNQLGLELKALSPTSINDDLLFVRSAVPDRTTYLHRPDLGRQLDDASRRLLIDKKRSFDAAFIIVDGLSAIAVHRHAARMLEAVFNLLVPADWNFAPIVMVEQGRVAIGDEIGQCLGAALSVVLIGERPGLSSPDSLGIYLTWSPYPGLTDADRNCISNIHADGLSYAAAAHKLAFLMTESRHRKLSGIHLKEDAKAIE